jgi:hypothetical protein
MKMATILLSVVFTLSISCTNEKEKEDFLKFYNFERTAFDSLKWIRTHIGAELSDFSKPEELVGPLTSATEEEIVQNLVADSIIQQRYDAYLTTNLIGENKVKILAANKLEIWKNWKALDQIQLQRLQLKGNKSPNKIKSLNNSYVKLFLTTHYLREQTQNMFNNLQAKYIDSKPN